MSDLATVVARRRTMRFAPIVVAFVLVLAAGCGPEQNSAPPSAGGGATVTARNPCELLSSTELAAIVSTVDKLAAAPAVTQTGPVGEFQGRKCTWTYPRKEVVTDTAEIALTAWHGIEYYTPDTTGGFTAVAGIGDAAHVGPGMFMFRKGPDVFLVAVTGDSNLDALRPAVAKAVVAKL
jgi:hypothetical protein